MMMARNNTLYSLLCLLLSSSLCLPLAAADIHKDSLIRVLQEAPDNSMQRAQVLQQLNAAYREEAPDESIFYGEELIRLAGSLKAYELLYLGHMSTGVAYAIKGNAPETALRHFIDALDIAKSQEGEEWELRQVKSRINIAGVHWQLENIGPALSYSYQNIAQLESMDVPLTLGDAYRTVALMHRTDGNYDSTFFYLDKALAIYEDKQDIHRKAFTLITIGDTYLQTGLHERARQALYQAQQHALRYQDSILLRDSYRGLSRAYLQLNRIDSAEHYARLLLAVAREKGLLPDLAEGYLTLSDIFAATNQLDSALHYYRLHSGAREQLISDEKTRVIQEMDTKYQAQEKARENRRLQEKYDLANFRNSLLLFSSLLFLFLVVLVAFYYHRERRRKTELEKLNEKITSVNSNQAALMNEKKHMVSLIAHDIRNPLSLIQLNTHALKHAESFDEEERRQMLAEIEQAATDIDRASLKIMEVENRTEKRPHIQNVTFDLIPVLKESIREFSPFARSKSIGMEFHSRQGHALITGDPFLFRHIIDNLLSNAVKYSPNNKKVMLSFKNNGNGLVFTVKDQGPGLSPEEQEQLFQQGKTFHSSHAAKGHSRGEGLYLTRRYVEAMGGKIKVESRPGQGASFTVSFPQPIVLNDEKGS